MSFLGISHSPSPIDQKPSHGTARPMVILRKAGETPMIPSRPGGEDTLLRSGDASSGALPNRPPVGHFQVVLAGLL
jgi:hypothetical protein